MPDYTKIPSYIPTVVMFLLTLRNEITKLVKEAKLCKRVVYFVDYIAQLLVIVGF